MRERVGEIQVLRSRIEKAAQNDGAKTGGGDSDYVTKYRQYKYSETVFELLLKQLEIARLDEGREGALVQVIDVALPPERKSHPRKATIAIRATFITFVVLLVLVFISHAIRGAASNPQTAAKLSHLRGSLFRLRRS